MSTATRTARAETSRTADQAIDAWLADQLLASLDPGAQALVTRGGETNRILLDLRQARADGAEARVRGEFHRVRYESACARYGMAPAPVSTRSLA